MMPVFVVMIDRYGRWVDSIWVQESAAVERVEQVEYSLRVSGTPAKCWYERARLEDGVLGKPSGRPKKLAKAA
jgi:hypothetical protein